MFIVKCPMCGYKAKFHDEMDACLISSCKKCGFDFLSNRCANPECRKHLHYSIKFCGACGNESNFYLDCCNTGITLIDEE